jgi:hypothetical protein
MKGWERFRPAPWGTAQERRPGRPERTVDQRPCSLPVPRQARENYLEPKHSNESEDKIANFPIRVCFTDVKQKGVEKKR